MCIKYAGDKEALLRLRELAECSGISRIRVRRLRAIWICRNFWTTETAWKRR